MLPKLLKISCIRELEVIHILFEVYAQDTPQTLAYPINSYEKRSSVCKRFI